MSFCLGVHAWYAIWQQIQLQGNTQRRQSELFRFLLACDPEGQAPIATFGSKVGAKNLWLGIKTLGDCDKNGMSDPKGKPKPRSALAIVFIFAPSVYAAGCVAS